MCLSCCLSVLLLLLLVSGGGISSREEDLLPAQVQACPHGVPGAPLRAILLSNTRRVKDVTIIPMVAIAALLPPVDEQHTTCLCRSSACKPLLCMQTQAATSLAHPG